MTASGSAASSGPDASSRVSITDRVPAPSDHELVDALVPPPQFQNARLDNYIPDPEYPSQGEAVERIKGFVASFTARPKLFRKTKAVLPGIYLDGGFGVGKTHLLAALWHAAPGVKRFGTFIEFTALVGALGYTGAREALKGSSLICIDEFELDDPGDTMMMSRLLGELMDSGTRIAATSNTPPNALGEGRFAASDFLREITALSNRFDTLRIDGVDYRQRDISGHSVTVPDDEVDERALALGATVAIDDFDPLMDHLRTVHPSRFVHLVRGLDALALHGVHELPDQHDALRLVAFIDRCYDAQLPIVASGVPLDTVFTDDALSGGFRKKYLRAVSRMNALTAAGAADAR